VGMRKKNKTIAILVGSALLTSAARLSYSMLRFHAVGARFHRVKVGETRQQVRKTLGIPNSYDGPCESGIGEHPRNCAWEYIYSPPLAPLMPEHYVVSFSKDDRVIRAEYVSSP
jgi:hypothetical protein